MQIIELPNPILRQKAQPVLEITPKILNLIKNMLTTLINKNDPPGVGLAAPQVGVSLQIFFIYPPFPPSPNPAKAIDENKVLLFINPKIIKTSGEYKPPKGSENLEGCLSLHGYYGPVKRSNEVTIEYETFNLNLLKQKNPKFPVATEKRTQTFSGFPAVIIQHEFDHLQGKLFVDRILEQKGKLYKIAKDAKGKEVLNEVNI